MKTYISVIICSHNPRLDYLERVLEALKSQTLPSNLWELLLIDNASEQIISSVIDLSWHSQSRHIREENLGKNYALLTGFKEAKGEILIIVDDDNVLAPDYLDVGLKISKDYSIIGAWGGQIIAALEENPPEWIKPDLANHLQNLACREFSRDKWSNFDRECETTPCGAGLCVRKNVVDKYVELVCNDPRRLILGRKGKQLIGCEDFDLAFTACDIGLGTGQFTSLKLTHLIPSRRLQEDYLLQLTEAISYSRIMLEYLRGRLLPKPNWRSSKIYLIYLRLRFGARRCRFYASSQKGIRLALEEIANLSKSAIG
jgi:glycosyltransferase involved in cell wall biosynthesis